MEVRYVFVASGQDAVVSAFKSIQSAAQESGSVVEKSYQRGEGAARRSAKRKVSEEEAAAEKIKATYEKNEAAYEKVLLKEVAAHERATQKKLAQEERIAKQREKQASKESFGAIVSSAARSTAIGAIRSIASGVTNFIGGAVREAFEVDDLARRLVINSRKAGQEFRNSTDVRKQFEQVAANTPGVTSKDVGEAANKYVSLTGDVDTALNNMQSFATVASATGANIGDVAEAAASLSEKFDVKETVQMQKALALLTFQGKEGAFELKDMAKQFQRLAASAAAFGIGEGLQGVQSLGGFLQIARTGTGSGRMATTATENVMAGLSKNALKLKGMGVDVHDKRGFEYVMGQVVAKVGGAAPGDTKMAALEEMFGKQGIRAINPLAATYRTAYEKNLSEGGDKKSAEAAGVAAMAEQFKKAGADAGDWSEIQRDAAKAQAAAGAQLTAAYEKLKSGISDAALPGLAAMTTSLAKLFTETNAVGTAFGFLADVAKANIDAVSGVVSFLQKAGVIDKKEGKAAAVSRTKKEFEEFTKGVNEEQLSADPEKLDKYLALRKAMDAAQEAYMPTPEKGARSNLGQIGPGARGTSDQFATMFAAASGYLPGSVGYNKNLETARDLDKQIIKTGGKEGDYSSGRQNDAQKQMLQARAEEQVRLNGEVTAKVLGDVNAALAMFEAALVKAGQASPGGAGGTIVGGP